MPLMTPFTAPPTASSQAQIQHLDPAALSALKDDGTSLGKFLSDPQNVIAARDDGVATYEYRRRGDPKTRTLYPAITPYATGRLDVGDGHELYYEEVGNPKGVPVVFLHGGPGGGLSDAYRQFFDPHKWRVILFDQRGAGNSTPFSNLDHNDTWSLVSDIEKLREKLGIASWTVFGGSWGATLAIAYAESHPDRVTGLVLRGIFLGRPSELDWLYKKGGASQLFPDSWQRFEDAIPQNERGDLARAYYKRLTGDDASERKRVAIAWTQWETAISKFYTDWNAVKSVEEDPKADAFARIEAHYMIHDLWLKKDQLLKDAARIADIPTIIVQGRYDTVCPATSAWDLHSRLRRAALVLVPDSGHSSMEPGTVSALVEATDYMASHLNK